MNNIILESFSLDPTYTLIDDPHIMFQESIIFSNYITEETSNPNNGNVLQKILNVIKKCMAWIAKQIGNLINWIKKLFSNKTKTVDQLAEELNISKSSSSKDDSPVDIPKLTSSPPKPDSQPENKINIDRIVKPLIIKFNNDNSFSITIKESLSKDLHDRAPTKGHPSKYKVNVLYAIYCMKHPDVIVKWAKLFTRIVKKEDVTQYEIKELNDYLDKVDDAMLAFSKSNPNMKITYEELSEFQGSVNLMNDLVSVYDKMDFTHLKPFTVMMLNRIAGMSLTIQVGMNGISTGLQQIYQIDGIYFGGIESPELLSEFVGKCIESNIPVKYTINNIYNVSGAVLKGSKADPDSPIVGQSRLVLIPDNKNIVYKVAISGMGIRANKNEIYVSNTYRKIDGSKYIASVLKSHNAIVNEMEKVEPISHADANIQQNMEEDLDKLSRDHNLSFRVTDINSGGFGKTKTGEIVILDYGFLNRVSRQ